MMVLAFHSQNFVPTGNWPLVKTGWIGVDIFFVLSGFIISYVHASDFTCLSLRAEARFLAIRLSRIYPVHIATLAAALGLLLLHAAAGSPVTDRFSAGSFIGNLLLVHAWDSYRLTWNYVSWSISAEWAAYLAFPILAYALVRVRSAAAALLGAAASLVAMIVALRGLGLDSMYVVSGHVLIRVAGGFSAGCFLYSAYRTKALEALPWGLITTSCLLVLALQVVWLESSFWAMPTIAILVLGLSYGRGAAARILSTNWAVFLGDISYSLYMVHFLTIEAVTALLRHGRLGTSILLLAIGYAIAIVATAAVTLLMHYWIEDPARNAMRRTIDVLIPVG